jgi:pimeloyl-ACP methyl ester carboxylesterase
VLALEYPHLVRSLVLAEPPIIPLLYRTPEGDSLRRRFLAGALEPARAAFRRGDSVEALRRFIDGESGAPGRFDNLPAPTRAATLAHAFELRQELLADPEQYMPQVACARLQRVATPVLLLRAQRSLRMFHIVLEELARCLNTETVITVPNAGHAIHATNPAQYNQVVLQYLATH